MEPVLVDTGPLVALLDRSDRHHARVAEALKSVRAPLTTVWPVITEAVYLLASQSAPAASRLLEMLDEGEVSILFQGKDDIARIRELMGKYGDLPMDLADAALVCAAEKERIGTVLTTDRRDFTVYRPAHVRRFKLLPE